jgi:hypothetical protein
MSNFVKLKRICKKNYEDLQCEIYDVRIFIKCIFVLYAFGMPNVDIIFPIFYVKLDKI